VSCYRMHLQMWSIGLWAVTCVTKSFSNQTNVQLQIVIDVSVYKKFFKSANLVPVAIDVCDKKYQM